MTYIPVTPAGTICILLEKNTEDEAWAALLKDAAHMPYPDKQAFIDRGYTVMAFIEEEIEFDHYDAGVQE